MNRFNQTLLTAALIGSTALLTVGCGEKTKSASIIAPASQPTKIQVPSTPQTDEMSVKVMLADIASHYEKPTTVVIELGIGDYYNWGYQGTEASHYSFKAQAGYKYFYAYGAREEFKSLFDYLVANDGEAVVEITVTTNPSHGSKEIWTLLDWKAI